MTSGIHAGWSSSSPSSSEHPEASVAYPLDVGITADGEQFRGPWRFDNAGMTGIRQRFVSATVGMRSGCVVYGLHRVNLLERCGVFHPAIIPDRILNEQLAMIGEFRQVDEVLWHRRYFARKGSIRARQMQVLFRGRPPLYTRLPFPLVHAAFLTWFVLVRGSTRPEVGRAAGDGARPLVHGLDEPRDRWALPTEPARADVRGS